MPSKTDVRRLPKANNHAAPYHHGDLRDALIAAAQDIMETEGLAALSLRAVSRRAGVSPAAPYHHFPDKQALLDAVAERGFDALTSAMTERMDRAGDSAARLDASGIGYVAFAVANPALFGLMSAMWVTIPRRGGRSIWHASAPTRCCSRRLPRRPRPPRPIRSNACAYGLSCTASPSSSWKAASSRGVWPHGR